MIKKAFLLALSLLPLSFLAYADESKFVVPQDRDGEMVRSVRETGVYVLCSSFSATTVGVQGIVEVFGVLTSTKSGTGEAFVNLFSSGTDNYSRLTGVEQLVPPIAISSANYNTFKVFDPPIISTEGVAMYVTSASCNAALFYRYLTTSTNEDLYVPVDDRGKKAHDPAFYGLQTATQSIAGAPANTVGTETLDFVSADTIVYGSSLTAPAKLLWYGFSAGTSTTGNYFTTYDSATLTGTPATPFLPNIVYKTLLLEDRIAQNTSVPNTTMFNWPWPLIVRQGLRMQRNFVAGSPDTFRVHARPARKLRY